MKWNNEGLVVTYDLEKKKVDYVNKILFKKNVFLEEQKAYKYKPMKNVNSRFIIRKLLSVVASIFFIGESIINFSFIKNEFRLLNKKISMRKKYDEKT